MRARKQAEADSFRLGKYTWSRWTQHMGLASEAKCLLTSSKEAAYSFTYPDTEGEHITKAVQELYLAATLYMIPRNNGEKPYPSLRNCICSCTGFDLNKTTDEKCCSALFNPTKDLTDLYNNAENDIANDNLSDDERQTIQTCTSSTVICCCLKRFESEEFFAG